MRAHLNKVSRQMKDDGKVGEARSCPTTPQQGSACPALSIYQILGSHKESSF